MKQSSLTLVRFRKDFAATREMPQVFDDESFKTFEGVIYRHGSVHLVDDRTALEAINTGYAEPINKGMAQ